MKSAELRSPVAPHWIVLLASLPVLLAGLWNTGQQLAGAMAEQSATSLPDWRNYILSWTAFEDGQAGVFGSTLLGASYFLPLLLTALITSMAWELGFSRIRKRPIVPGFLLAPWLFTFLLPASLPVWQAAIGLSFGLVFGKLIFGGERYLVNPALLGVVFLLHGYPSAFRDTGLLPIGNLPSDWSLLTSGVDGIAATGAGWWKFFSGAEVSLMATNSALAILIAGIFLVAVKQINWRLPVASLLILLLPVTDLAWQWHLAVGNFAFCLVFLASDRHVAPVTNLGHWCFGILFAGVTLLIRQANPVHPEGSFYALLFACLFIPLFDQLAVLRRRRPAAGEYAP